MPPIDLLATFADPNFEPVGFACVACLAVVLLIRGAHQARLPAPREWEDW